MTLLGSNLALFVVFTVSAAIELFFFMMQRSALEISRASRIGDREGRLMLPNWYLMVWPAKLIKWTAAIYVGIKISWLIAALLLATAFLFHVFVPIPHGPFISVFRRKLVKELGDAVQMGSGAESGNYAHLYRKLFEASKDSRFD
jgi:hypothetical protein